MTRDPEQATADLRRAVRRLVEGASAEQLEAMREAFYVDDFPSTDVLVLRPNDAMAEVTDLMSHAIGLAFEDDVLDRAADPLAEVEGRSPRPWWEEHSPRCGHDFRGCAPECPKDRRERLEAAGGKPTGYSEAPGGTFTALIWDAPGGPLRIDRTVNAAGTVLTERIEAIIITDREPLTIGQRVTIPARYCGEDCHGVRVGTVAYVDIRCERAIVDVPGFPPLSVPIGEAEAA